MLSATAIDGGEAEQIRFHVPLEDIRPGGLEPPSPSIVGHIQAQYLLLRAYRLSLLHSTAPLTSLQRSRVIPKDYLLVPVVMALEINDECSTLRGRQPNQALRSPTLASTDSHRADSGWEEHPLQLPDNSSILRCPQNMSGS